MRANRPIKRPAFVISLNKEHKSEKGPGLMALSSEWARQRQDSRMASSWTSPLNFGRDVGKPREKFSPQVEDVSVVEHHFVQTRGPSRDSAVIPVVVPPLKLSLPAPPRSPPHADAMASARGAVGVAPEKNRDSSEVAAILAEVEARGAVTDRPRTSAYSKEEWWADNLCAEQRRGEGFSSLRTSRELQAFSHDWTSPAGKRDAFVNRYMALVSRGKTTKVDLALDIRDVAWAPRRDTMDPEKGDSLDLHSKKVAEEAMRRKLEHFRKRLKPRKDRPWVPVTAEEAGGGRPALLDGDMSGHEARRALYTVMQHARNSGSESRVTWTAPPAPLSARSNRTANDFKF